MSDLERRYTRLVRWCYPAGYRRERGAELVGTYLDLAGPDRRRPSLADAWDLAAGGTRQRLRDAEALGLADGFRLAAALALTTTSAYAAGWTMVELQPPPAESGLPSLGPQVWTAGIAGWVAWLLVAVVHLVAPGRWTRVAAGMALFCTVAVVPFAALTGELRPPLFVLLPQVALGIVALGATNRFRLLPLLSAGTGALVASIFLPREDFIIIGYYGWYAGQALPVGGVTLLIAAILLAVVLAASGDHRGGWALLVLAVPIGMLCLNPLAGVLDGASNGAPNPTWQSLAVVATAVGVAGPALVLLVVTAVRRRRPGPDLGTPLR